MTRPDARIDWSRYRRPWLRANQMTRETRELADKWLEELEKLWEERIQKPKFANEFPLLSDEQVLKELGAVIQKIRNGEIPSDVGDMTEHADLTNEEFEAFLTSLPQDRQSQIKRVRAKTHPTDLEELGEALEESEEGLTRDTDVFAALGKLREPIHKRVTGAFDLLQCLVSEEVQQAHTDTEKAEAEKLGSLVQRLRDKAPKKAAQASEKLALLVPAARKNEERKLREKIAKRVSIERGIKDHGAVIVLVAGGGAAGKTTFAKRLKRVVESTFRLKCEKLDLDRYFLPIEAIGGRASDGKYDNPVNSALELAVEHIRALSTGGNIDRLLLPSHDRNEHKLERQSTESAERFLGVQVIIVEGLYTLGPCFGELGEVRVYIDASPTDRAKGRVWRDINVRRRSEKHVVDILLGREAYHQTFVEPTQMVADYIIRRSPTGGDLQVDYPDEIQECFLQAFEAVELPPEKAAEAFRLFEKCLAERNKRRASRTEF